MDSAHLKQNICRICLDDGVALDWNNTLNEFCDTTYKDCFYKYTQLECLALDPFSPMLCQICLNGLYNTHTLISRALESHKYLQETNFTNLMLESTLEEDIKDVPTEFETILVENIKGEPITQDHFVDENSGEESIIKPIITRAAKRPKRYTSTTSVTTKQGRYKINSDKCIKIAKNRRKSVEVLTKHVVEQYPNSKKLLSGRETTVVKKKEPIVMLEDDLLKIEIKDSDTPEVEQKEKRMCSICSKLLKNIYAVRMHEKTHVEKRERKETCKVCGVKFYEKRDLHAHNLVHMENREKKHGCDFCNKAFYNKGALNIHRRIHLGQMIPCSLCTKQFFRQIDLERHMTSHSATAINSDTKKRSRYFVRCKHCDKSILSTSFKSHTAAHLNEPLMKCSICSKEFFRRGSCVLHVKKVHQKTNAEYNDFIIQYKQNRLTRLFLEQKADIQFEGQ